MMNATPRLLRLNRAVVLMFLCQHLLPTAAEASKLGSTILESYYDSPQGVRDVALSLREVATGKRLWLTRPFDPSGYFTEMATVGDDGYVYTTEVSDKGTLSCLRHAANGSVAVCEALPGYNPEEQWHGLYPTCVASPGVKTDGFSEFKKVFIFNVAAYGTPVTSLVNLTLPSGVVLTGSPSVYAAAPGLVLVDGGDGCVHAYLTEGSDAGKMLWTFKYTNGPLPALASVTVISNSKEALFLTVTKYLTDDYDDDDEFPDVCVLMSMDRTTGKQLWATAMDSGFDWCDFLIDYSATSILCQGRKSTTGYLPSGNWWLISKADGSVTDHGSLPADPAGGLLQIYYPIGEAGEAGVVLTSAHPSKGHSTVSFLPSLSAETRAWSKRFPLDTIIAPATDNQHIVLFMALGAAGLDLNGNVLWNATNEEAALDGATLYL